MVATGSLSLYYHDNVKKNSMSFSTERVALILRDSETQWLVLISKPHSAVAWPNAITMPDLWCGNFDQTDVMWTLSIHWSVAQSGHFHMGYSAGRMANAIMFNICINNLQLLDYASCFFPPFSRRSMYTPAHFKWSLIMPKGGSGALHLSFSSCEGGPQLWLCPHELALCISDWNTKSEWLSLF